ncbi:L-rhamnose/proton symporter RhaT [Anaeromicropila herbilytica]|uniref:Sugar:proton symporter n=1 Tax=Anaeromicropila herbilytica TaxID=2785025 RepID=A0A7R7IBX4_9FIRM|nr:L-rhamnose/proton symporter RhaT [Anaeromicropila herbilytica]BCN30037.1 sugar:proton symporter [Anaeromicropila herbilytica]
MASYGFIVLILAGIFQGSFGLGMKNYKPFSWEAFWGLFSLVGAFIIPQAIMRVEVPNYMEYILDTPAKTVVLAMICGFIWGISALLFGKAIDSIGMSLTYGLNMGISASLGSFLSLFILGDLPKTKVLVTLIIGYIVMLLGVFVITKAGLLKDKESKANKDNESNPLFVRGIMLAMFAGLGSAAMNIGFTFANKSVDLAIQDGVKPINASLISWIIVLAGGVIPQVVYPIYLMIKNRTYKNYVQKGCHVAYGKLLVTSILWFLALDVYAKASILLGDLGPVVGWVAFNALSLIISNGWGLLTGEWKGFIIPKKLLLYGNLILVVSFIIVGLANSL